MLTGNNNLQIKQIIQWNLGLIVVIGLYGIVTDEPYWRGVGHEPYLYDYFFWFALALNGPSGFLADYLSLLTKTHSEYRYLIQYALWGLLLWPQWKAYDWFTRWYQGESRRIVLYIIASLFIIGAGLIAYQTWLLERRANEFFANDYYWSVRTIGIACAGIVLLVYANIRLFFKSNSR